jgi:hypothetical protein
MKEDLFAERMTEITSAFDNGDYQSSLELSKELKRQILEEENHEGPQLGWAHFYQFKSLFMAKEYPEAYQLMVTPLPKLFALDPDNAAYMCSAASEVAMLLKLPEDVVKFGTRCMEFRSEAQNPVDALRCARQTCIYLESLERNDLNASFAHYQVEQGIRWEDAAPFTHGCRWLFLNVEQTHNLDIASYLYTILVKKSLIPQKGADGIPADFLVVKARVFGSSWFREIESTLQQEPPPNHNP